MITVQQYSDGFGIKIGETVYTFSNEDSLEGLAELLNSLGLDTDFEIIY